MPLKRYSYRAHPSYEQVQGLARLFGCVRVVWNDSLAACLAARARGEKKPTSTALSKTLTAAKKTPERAWLNEVSATPLQQAQRDLDQAYSNFFASISGKRKGGRVGAPKFKKRSSRQTARFVGNIFAVREIAPGKGAVRLSKVGGNGSDWVRFKMSRSLPAKPSSVTIIRDTDGRYHVSFVVEVPAESRKPEPDERPTAGVDLGLTDLAAIAYTDGSREKIANPRWARKGSRKLAKAQRALARKQRGSKNREKARLRVAIEHRKVREARQDFHHKLALQLVRENQAIALEDLNVAGLARTRLAKSVHDAGWRQLVRLIEEKAAEYGCEVTRIGRSEPTSQVCSVCGVKDGKKPLRVRQWRCQECLTLLDRDFNAALNIVLAAGHAERLNARGGDVRRKLASANPDEAGTRQTPVLRN